MNENRCKNAIKSGTTTTATKKTKVDEDEDDSSSSSKQTTNRPVEERERLSFSTKQASKQAIREV